VLTLAFATVVREAVVRDALAVADVLTEVRRAAVTERELAAVFVAEVFLAVGLAAARLARTETLVGDGAYAACPNATRFSGPASTQIPRQKRVAVFQFNLRAISAHLQTNRGR
jgi:hypothetical protein